MLFRGQSALEMPCGYQIWSKEHLTRELCIAEVKGHTGVKPGSTGDQFAYEYPIWLPNLVREAPD